jgi:hypothetical protein
VQTLCSVSQSFTPGSSTADQIVTALGAAVGADPTCVAAGVTAVVTTQGTQGGEGEITTRSALSLSAPGVVGRELFPEVQGKTYGLLQLDGLGLPLTKQIEPPMMTLALPVGGGGAAGGSLTISEVTSLGRCSYTVPTVAGDSATTIANNVAAMFNSSSNDNSCRDLQKARDVILANLTSGLANVVFSAGEQVSIQSSDANVTATIGPTGW